MYQEVLPGLKGDILEVGSGIGTFSEKIIFDFPNSKVTLTDISDNYVNELLARFRDDKVSIHKLDLNQKSHYEKIGHEKFDSILAINVLEHVENDEFALFQLYKMLKKEGVLVLLVPAHKFLFNAIDRKVGHFRRYSKKEMISKIQKAQFSIDKIFFFNMIGIIGWYVNGSIFSDSTVNPIAVKIFDRIVPLSKHVERLIAKKIGLSLICFLKK